MGCYINRVIPMFGRHIGNAAAEVAVKFQSDWKSLIINLHFTRSCGKTSIHLVNRGSHFIGTCWWRDFCGSWLFVINQLHPCPVTLLVKLCKRKKIRWCRAYSSGSKGGMQNVSFSYINNSDFDGSLSGKLQIYVFYSELSWITDLLFYQEYICNIG